MMLSSQVVWLTVFVLSVPVVRADVFSSAADDEPARASHGGHLHSKSVAGLPGGNCVHLNP